MKNNGPPDFSLGNDVVDLRALEVPLHPRYVERVFTQREQEWIGSSPSKLWVCWAAKESAYKAVKRLRKKTIFIPKRFVYSPDTSRVHYKDLLLHIAIQNGSECIYTICALTKATLTAAVKNSWVVDITSDERYHGLHPSLAARALLRNKLGMSSRMPQELCFSSPCPSAIPYLLLNGEILDDLISFSHDGRFVMASYLSQAFEVAPYL